MGRGIVVTQRTANTLIFILLLAVSLPMTLLIMRLMGTTSREINTIYKGMELVGNGDLTHRIDLTGDDELVEFARAFDQMTNRLQTIAVSKNVLEQEVEKHKRTAEKLRESTKASANLMQDAVEARCEAEKFSVELLASEESIKASLKEKEILLQEVHHRVKNNLQIISSLVSLQMDNLSEPSLQTLLSDVRDRVQTMALVHEKLYQSADLGAVDFAEYAQSLMRYLWRMSDASVSSIHLIPVLKPLTLSIEKAVPCGLILNELVGNALKHAFKNRPDGEVKVTLNINEAGLISLRVQDNGVGLPPDVDWRQAKTLGLRLVQMLAAQLKGRVEAYPVTGGGTDFKVQFPG